MSPLSWEHNEIIFVHYSEYAQEVDDDMVFKVTINLSFTAYMGMTTILQDLMTCFILNLRIVHLGTCLSR